MSNSQRLCKNNFNVFCYTFGELIKVNVNFNFEEIQCLKSKFKSLYYAYFGCAIGDQDKHWAPHFCCINCSSRLHRWFAGKKVSLEFAVAMVWRE